MEKLKKNRENCSRSTSAKKPLEAPKRRWDNNNKTDLDELVC